jgi:hypothetical protein
MVTTGWYLCRLLLHILYLNHIRLQFCRNMHPLLIRSNGIASLVTNKSCSGEHRTEWLNDD